jgi:hypothetical protein
MFKKVISAILLATTVTFGASNVLFGAERNYGSFILNTEIPNTLFFTNEIKENDSFELRKALRNHDIQNIVLASPGGSVWEALNMAGIIFDKKLRTFVPEQGNCASACAFLFLAGHERLIDGKLGVHQTYSQNYKDKKTVRETQYVTQFTVSEIIGFLNEFGTPAFVYERMFQGIDMYYFDDFEVAQLNSDNFGLSTKDRVSMDQYAASKLKDNKSLFSPNKKYSKRELIALIQKRLNELGCDVGVVDGYWGQKTDAAAIQFATKAGLPTSPDELISEEFVKALANADEGFCEDMHSQGQLAFAESYEYSCNNGPKFNDTWSILHHDTGSGVVHIMNTKGETISLKYQGKSFTTNDNNNGLFNTNSSGIVDSFSYASKLCSNITFEAKN